VTRFNYIITIHNKQEVLERTLAGVEQCCSEASVIYPVLDGCTDRSAEIVAEFARRTSRQVIVTETPDVHEIQSINAALRQIDQGFTVCLQDDVVLGEPELETKVRSLYEREGPQLGVVSFCRAANVRRTGWLRQLRSSGLVPLVEECDLLRQPADTCPGGRAVPYGTLVYRMVAIKSPVCIPETVRTRVGLLDEDLAPYSWDDHDYCVRVLQAGFRNALFPLRFTSAPEWGGTRNDPGFPAAATMIHKRNRRHIWRKHGAFIAQYRKRDRQ